MKHIAAFLFALIMLFGLLAGCAEDDSPVPIGSEVWETMPQLTYGVMEYEKLEVLPWYKGRTEATSKNQLAETEQGYYVSLDHLLYMDRLDPDRWIPVCSMPDCEHRETDNSCGAYPGFGSGGFLLHEGRIYIVAHMQNYPALSLQDGDQNMGPGIVSKLYNGSNLRIEYLGTEEMGSSAFGYTSMLTAQGWFYNVKQMLSDGSGVATSWFVGDDGAQKISEKFFDSYNDTPMDDAWPASLKGDPVFYHTALGNKLYGIRNGEIYEVDAAQYEPGGGYLSGNIIRQFRQNDGYYDINIETGEVVFLSPAQLENSKSTIMLPNCIAETTLSSKSHPEGTAHSLVIFDGESWRSVSLPEELRSAKRVTAFSLLAVASDRLLFYYVGEQGQCFYQVMLDAEILTAEQFGMVG